MTILKNLAVEFYDTPVSQRVKLGKETPKNKFIKRGRPPAKKYGFLRDCSGVREGDNLAQQPFL